jgi:HSP20 family protein
MTEERERNVPQIYHLRPGALLDGMMHRVLNERALYIDRSWLPNIMNSGYRIPAIDIMEEADRFVLHADMPGMTKEDVSIELGEGIMELSAKKDQVKEERSEGYLRKERGSMSFHRRLLIPDGVDTDNVQAKLTDGVLEVVLPKVKKVDPQRKKVDVR